MSQLKRQEAFVPTAKISNYLLSASNSRGKIDFFVMMGYSPDRVEALEADLISIAHDGHVVDSSENLFGIKYVIDGAILTPIARIVTVRTVWINEFDEPGLRFVTAYPAPKEV